MKYYIIAGEASGDLHGANLMKELKAVDESAEFRFWGGDLMMEQDANIVKHYHELAFMGFAEVILNLPTILSNIHNCKKDILDYAPDALILIDYPGFNMRIAKFAKEAKMNVFYYISPQIWAWKESRVHKIKRSVDKMFVILPFEKEFYKRFEYNVDFVGHPLLDAVNDFSSQPALEINSTKPIIALLPGSRKQEISTMLPIMLSMQKHFMDYQFVIAGAPSQNIKFYQPFIEKSDVKIVFNQTYQLLQKSHAALVTSGTATLEAALFGVPEVVCYKGSAISFSIAKKLVKVKFISLVNLIMDKEIVKELIQHDLNEKNLKSELSKLLDTDSRNIMLKDYKDLKVKLGGSGASKKTAELIYSFMKKKINIYF